ncbi:hypothetical protein OG799_27965 [Micromonospora sp. NBC_00898]|uniref:hypothetical protein n=1 Tax=Micromonospora sp. NBC_00898 TaxID=2975981 RepID=UPI0038690FF9|nr:hypothetical protein OG799_27965 [Micromonospora sp. NBC_00898]
MAAARPTGHDIPNARGRSKAWKQAALWIGITAVVVAFCAVGAFTNDSDSLTVPAPAADERTDTVPLLQEAAASQGICYGWRLTDYPTVTSVGSNLGDGIAVGEDPRCLRWIEVEADVNYTSESSEASDSASVRVNGSDDVDAADLSSIQRGLERFGLDDDAFVDDPGWAVTRAATTLPLLAAEAGVAQPAAPPSVEPAAAASPLPAAGSDFWRDRWGWLIAVTGLLLLAALFVTVGVVQRRRQLRGVVPAQRAGAEAAGRTRETA